MVYYIVSGLFLLLFWCPCMVINVNVQYNGGLLPGIILLTQCYFHRGTHFKSHEEVLYLQPLIPPKRFDIFPPKGGSYVNKILYKNLDLTQAFPNKISFHFLWVKMLH